jgi:N6-L-threonylcarbamoyladenine synthase
MESPEPVMLPEAITADLCATFQDTAFSHVEDRLSRALDYVDDRNIKINGLVVVGGVAANKELRRRLLKLLEARRIAELEELNNDETIAVTNVESIPLVFPPINLCTDNGVMAAWAGIEKLYLGISDAVENVEPIARWPLGSPIEEGKIVFPKKKYSKK